MSTNRLIRLCGVFAPTVASGVARTAASAVLLAGCTALNEQQEQEPAPIVVPSDYLSQMGFPSPPVRFSDRWSPPPIRPLGEPPQIVGFGDWLYVARGDRVFALDTRDATAAPRSVLRKAAVHALHVEGDRLQVLASVSPEDPLEVERRSPLVVYELAIGADPGQPTLIGESPAGEGTFVRAWRLGDGRWVTVSADYPRVCEPDGVLFRYFDRPARMLVTTTGRDSMAVDADGFIETESGFVLSEGGIDGLPATLHVFEMLPAGATHESTVTIDAGIAETRIGVFERSLALFQFGSDGPQLLVYDTRAPGTAAARSAASLTLPLPFESAWNGIQAARFAGRFVLVPGVGPDGGATAPGVIIDWARQGGPIVTAEIPADLPHVQRLGERWLAWGQTRSVLFTLGAEGTFDAPLELGSTGADGRADAVFWEASTEQAILAHAVPGTGVPGAPRLEQAVSVLDFTSDRLEWRPGPPVTGLLTAPQYLQEPSLQMAHVGDGLYARTTPDFDAGDPWQVERIDGTAAESHVLAPAERVVARASGALGSAEVRVDDRGRRWVRLEGAGTSTDVELDVAADRLVPAGDAFVSYSFGNPRDCAGMECFPGQAPALSVFALNPPRLVGSVVASPPPDEDSSRSWNEVIVQGEQVAVLEGRRRRGVRPGEEWLYAVDTTRGQLTDPVLLELDAEGFHGSVKVDAAASEGLALMTMTESNPESTRARIRLRRLPSLDAAGVAAAESGTIRGFPAYVSGNQVIGIEPELLPGGDSARVLVHHQVLEGGSASVMKTLRLGSGYQGLLWARERGYILLASERCDGPITTLSTLRLSQGHLTLGADLTLPGLEWSLVRATDEVVVLAHRDQYAIIDVSAGRMALRAYETHGSGTVVDVSGSDVSFIEN